MSGLLRALMLGLALLAPVVAAGTAPEILLASVYRAQVDVTQYLVSEKLDGVRALWDGKSLRFRSGKPIHAPAWFVAGLPQQALDGELWMGRGSFEQLSGTVRKETPVDAEWRQVRYMIFELPWAPGSFRERVDQIRLLVSRANVSWLQQVEQFGVADDAGLRQQLAAVVAAGGEGLILHRADALYETGRSDTLLKLKPWLDADAEVVGHRAGKGRHVGRLGALLVRTPEGKTFLLGTGFSDELRRNPPPIGAWVSYRYRELTNTGLPRFASFLRARED
ncbi:DNA ligase [uncultured Dechloromonas sp.]|uniref:DNA ligase n=1 Tax=uncultured Dechloromonas sp. TaxID=171719 RepID=UPI0025EBE8AA|nr:DNA ligase [uncultured Dechloromonas sp.]